MENKHVDKCRSFSNIIAHYSVIVRPTASLLITIRASVSFVRNKVYLGVWKQITFIIKWLIYSFVVTAGSAWLASEHWADSFELITGAEILM